MGLKEWVEPNIDQPEKPEPDANKKLGDSSVVERERDKKVGFEIRK